MPRGKRQALALFPIPHNVPTSPAATPTTRGQAAEQRAAEHLHAHGLRVLARNWKTPGRGGGELDLIACERDGTIVFVEVRARSSARFGGAAASISATKRARIQYAATQWLAQHCGNALPPCRFDAIVLDGPHIQWLRAAFEASA